VAEQLDELQAAIYSALAGDSALVAVVGARIYDRVPVHATYPFVSFGQVVTAPWSGDAFEGAETFWTVDTWSRAGGRVELSAMMTRVHAVLHDAALPLSTLSLVSSRLSDGRVLPDPDNETLHGVQRFRILTQHT